MALQIQHWNFSGYNGVRSPVYPLFLLMCGLDFNTIRLAQGALGILAALMLYMIVRYRTDNRNMAMLTGLLFSVSVSWLLYEITILSETLTMFLLILMVLLLAHLYHVRKNLLVITFSLGLVVSLIALTRPLFLFLPPLCFAGVYWFLRPSEKRVWKYLLGFSMPMLMLILGWCAFNKSTTGYFGTTTLMGYNLTQHSGAFIELAPPEYAELQSVYLKYRKEVMAQTHSHSMTIWRAYPEMQARTGLSYAELSKELTKMSMDLFLHHPFLYLKSVAHAWVLFWSVPPTNPATSHLENPTVAGIIRVLLWGEKYPLLALNILFLGASIVMAFRRITGRSVGEWKFDGLLVAIVLGGSIVQALMEFGENARYAVPFQPLILLSVVLILWHFLPASKKYPVNEPLLRSVARHPIKSPGDAALLDSGNSPLHTS
jgi:hypothetical protein